MGRRVFLGCALLAASLAQARFPEKTYVIRWKLDGEGRIAGDTVCHDYETGTVDFRNCRRQAQTLFRDQCSKYKSSSPNSEQEKLYCDAARTFNPILRR